MFEITKQNITQCSRISSLIRKGLTQFTNNVIQQPSGIYFQSMGQMYLTNANWRLLTYVNISNYNEKYLTIHEIVQQIEQSCQLGRELELGTSDNPCIHYSHQSANFLNEINNNRNNVIRIIEQPNTNVLRFKRGLINLVGRTANVLFGTCDDQDAEYFYKKIRELENAKAQLLQAAETQVNIVQSVVTNVNDSLIQIEKIQGSLKEKYNYLLHEVQAEKVAIGIMEFTTALTQKISLLNLILAQYAYETETLGTIVNTALQGFVHSSLININTIVQQLREIKSQLPLGLGLPPNIDKIGMSDLMRLVDINVVYVQNVLIFTFEIPLISNNYEFILYKPLPLPIKVKNNVYAIIESTSDYFGLGKSRLYYIQMTLLQLKNCKKSVELYICPHEQQPHQLDETCETRIFRNPHTLPSSCNLRYVKLNVNVWHRLEKTNSWVYVTNGENVLVKCENITIPITVNINGTGVFTLDNYCEANTDDNNILIPKRIIISKTHADFVPQLNFTIHFQPHIDLAGKISNNSLFVKENRIRDNLIKLSENAKSIQELQSKLHETPNDDIEKQQSFFYITISLLAIISVGLSILLVYSRFKNICHNVEKNTLQKVYEDINLDNINVKETTSDAITGKSLPKIL